MPPRRRPRSWLAGRLRSAAGVVQRLAGRVEPAGHLPTPSQAPVATPRRFGEPPQHWLDLVAAHAPGLLHDLDLDPPGAEPAEGRDEPAGGPGFGDRLDQDGPDRWTAATRPAHPVGEDAGFPADSMDGRAPGTVGRRAPGTVGSRPGRATSTSGTDLAGHPDGRGRAASATRATVGDGATVDPAYGVDGPEMATGGGGPDGSHSTSGTGRSAHASSAADRPGGPGMSGAGPPRGSSDAFAVALTAEVPLASDGDRRSPGRLLDGWRLRPPFGRVAATGPARDGTPAADSRGLPRIGEPTSPASPPTPTAHTAPVEILEDFGPSRGTYLPRSTTDSAGVAGASPDRGVGRHGRSTVGEADTGWGSTEGGMTAAGGVAVTGDGLWPALPDDRARSGQRVGERWGPGAGDRNGSAARAAGVAWTGSAYRDPGVGRGPESAVFQADATALDPWPALPDDTALWSVAGAAVDTAQLTRLDREQAGD